MPAIERILFPTDFSSSAGHAFEQALFLAELLEAELHVLHVVALHDVDLTDPKDRFPELQQIEDHLDRVAQSEMHDLLEPHRETTLQISQVRRRGVAPGPCILDYAREQEIDLIVMGTHGRRGVRRLVLGSVAEEVMRLAECPVLCSRQGSEPRGVGAIRTIVVPVDHSTNSSRALTMGKELARLYQARIVVSHVLESRHHPGGYTPGGERLVPNADQLLEKAETWLRQLVADVPGPDVPFELHVSLGRTVSEVLALAGKVDADLIVLGSQGISGLQYLIFGSTAEGVVRQAECSVLTVKAIASDEATETVDA